MSVLISEKNKLKLKHNKKAGLKGLDRGMYSKFGPNFFWMMV